MERDDYELIAELKSGSESAFSTLYNNQVSKIYAYALNIVKSPALAEDVVQETFVKLWENASNLQNDSNISAYLFTITRNLCLNLIRRAKKETWITDEIIAFAIDALDNGVEYTQHQQLKVLLNDAIAQLPPKRKMIYELCKIKGMSYQQVAEQLNLSQSTVNSQMVKAIKSVQQYLVKHGALVLILIAR